MILSAVNQHCSLYNPLSCLRAAISRQLSACLHLLQGRVGADAVAKLAACVSCHSR